MTKTIFKLSDISNEINKNITIRIFYSKNEKDYNIICNDLQNELTIVKNNIDQTSDWDNIKKIINTYERVYIPNNESIAKYKPISRAYFKLWETFYDFPDLGHNLDKKIVSLHLAEGPGGFIEALQNYRRKIYQFNDQIFATTLQPSESRIPGWKGKVQNLNNINLFYGDICENNYYMKVMNMMENQKAHIITADGAFDCSNDFNKQERTSAKLIFGEIILALANQKIDGSFVIKIFDCFDIITIKMIYFLTMYYNNVYITKPLTSREGNSEKYIVAQNFKGININEIIKLNNILEIWNKLDNYHVIDIFGFNLSQKIIDEISEFNESIIKKQIISLNRGIKIIKNGITQSSIKTIQNRQKQMAVKWCKKYEVNFIKNNTY
jgi:23S rRNA U2552 (ribose-2'-O)-methylase RlmE/FtsJ